MSREEESSKPIRDSCCHLFSVALPRKSFVARQRHSLTSVDPSSDRGQGPFLADKSALLILSEKAFVRGLGIQIGSPTRRNSELGKVLVADPKPPTAGGQHPLREPPPAANRIPTHIAQQRDVRVKEFVEEALVASPLVSYCGQRNTPLVCALCGNAATRVLIFAEEFRSKFATRRMIWRLAVGECSERFTTKMPVTMNEACHVAVLQLRGDAESGWAYLPGVLVGGQDPSLKKLPGIGVHRKGMCARAFGNEFIGGIGTTRLTVSTVEKQELLEVRSCDGSP